jgi:preprotein translocase subunit SecY
MALLDGRKTYKPFVYDQAHAYWLKQQNAHWLHTEIAMSPDLQDWRESLSETERNVVGGVLKGFVQTEIVVNDYWTNKVAKWFPHPEVAMMATAFGNMETIHTIAYAQLNDSLGLTDYEAFMQEPAAKAKLDRLIEVPEVPSKKTVDYLEAMIALGVDYPKEIAQYIVFAVIALFVIIAVVAVTEAERPVPVTYSRQAHGTTTGAGGTNTYIPLRINQAGVMPIIFALSILLFPQIIANYLSHASNVLVADWATRISLLLTNQWFHGVVYFAFVFIFTYFYTAVTFEPKQVSENLQKSGAFIPGIRPGEHTTDYLANIVTRITFVGALFLGAIAVLPVIMQGVTGNQALNIGGTALLIVVSVVLDLIKRVDAQVSMREY